MSNQFRERAQFRGLRNEKKIFRAIFRRTVLLEPTRADRFDIRAGSNVEFSETTQDFGETDLLEPTRADSSDIRVDSNVEQAFFYKTLRTAKRCSQTLKTLNLHSPEPFSLQITRLTS